MDRGACQAIVHRVAKSQTQLSDFHSGLHITGRNLKCYDFYVKSVWQFLKKLNIKVSDIFGNLSVFRKYSRDTEKA